jgi:hypothetical protein
VRVKEHAAGRLAEAAICELKIERRHWLEVDMTNALISVERIENAILFVRGQKVLLDRNLAELYGVTTFNLNKAVKRNIGRFPEDFMFQLTKKEAEALRFQTGMSKSSGRGGRRYLPYVFTEQGVAMLSSAPSATPSTYSAGMRPNSFRSILNRKPVMWRGGLKEAIFGDGAR